MDNQSDRFLEKLAGAAILLTIAVIAVPILLDEPDQGPDWAMPPFSEEAVAVSTPASPEQRIVDDEEIEPPVPEAGLEQDLPEAKAWVVQLGGFSQHSNAKSQQESLRDAGYKAFVKTMVIDEKEIFLVQVGPLLSRDEADSLRQRLYSERQVKGIIKRYP